jgi:hypothetical protein
VSASARPRAPSQWTARRIVSGSRLVFGSASVAPVLAGLLVGCGSVHLPAPPYGPQAVRDEDWVAVVSAPPPVQPQEPGGAPNAHTFWIDGQWVYQRGPRKWVWEKGSWCEAPEGLAYYAKPQLRRIRTTGKPTLRWNEAENRGEEVAPSEDNFQWLRGRFFVRDRVNGGVLPMEGSALCYPPTGLGDPPVK